MAELKTLTDTRYEKLLKELRKVLQEGRQRAEAAARQELVQTYWEIGKRLSEENLTGNANYGDSILEDLAEDLDMDVSALRRSVLF